MTLPDDTRIAGQKTVADWKAMRGRLNGAAVPAIWEEAFGDFFKARLDSRYFEPIKAIEKMGQDVGEGFAIVTLHCSVIEFLASTLEGKSYRYREKGSQRLGKFEFSNSRDMFVSFLEKNEPFKGMFSEIGTAEDFYTSVRCGLLHEARTKRQWRIVVCSSASQAIDASARVIYRNLMQPAFNQFIDWYGERLRTDSNLQTAFIRKFDCLCEE